MWNPKWFHCSVYLQQQVCWQGHLIPPSNTAFLVVIAALDKRVRLQRFLLITFASIWTCRLQPMEDTLYYTGLFFHRFNLLQHSGEKFLHPETLLGLEDCWKAGRMKQQRSQPLFFSFSLISFWSEARDCPGAEITLFFTCATIKRKILDIYLYWNPLFTVDCYQ